MISGSFSGAAHPGSSAKVQIQDVHFSTKAKGAKGKHGKGKPTHTYDVQSSNHASQRRRGAGRGAAAPR